MFSPGKAPLEPANLSRWKGVSFHARGDGKTYRLMLFAKSRGIFPMTSTFTAGPQWEEVSVPFSAFAGFDGRDLVGMVFAAGPEPGDFSFRIDQVRLR